MKQQKQTGKTSGKTILLIVGNEGGGTYNSVRILVKYVSNCHPLHVVSMGPGKLVDTLKNLGVDVYVMGTTEPAIIHKPGHWRRIRSLFMMFRNAFWLAGRIGLLLHYIRKNNIAVVHTNPGYPAVISAMARFLTKFSFVCHWRGVTLGAPMKRFSGLLSYTVARFLAISRAVKASLPEPMQAKHISYLD